MQPYRLTHSLPNLHRAIANHSQIISYQLNRSWLSISTASPNLPTSAISDSTNEAINRSPKHRIPGGALAFETRKPGAPDRVTHRVRSPDPGDYLPSLTTNYRVGYLPGAVCRLWFDCCGGGVSTLLTSLLTLTSSTLEELEMS